MECIYYQQLYEEEHILLSTQAEWNYILHQQLCGILNLICIHW